MVVRFAWEQVAATTAPAPGPGCSHAYRPVGVALDAGDACCSSTVPCITLMSHSIVRSSSLDMLRHVDQHICSILTLDTSPQDSKPAHQGLLISLAVCAQPMQSQHLPTQRPPVVPQSTLHTVTSAGCCLQPSSPLKPPLTPSFFLPAGVNIFDTADSYVSASPEVCMSVLLAHAGQ